MKALAWNMRLETIHRFLEGYHAQQIADKRHFELSKGGIIIGSGVLPSFSAFQSSLFAVGDTPSSTLYPTLIPPISGLKLPDKVAEPHDTSDRFNISPRNLESRDVPTIDDTNVSNNVEICNADYQRVSPLCHVCHVSTSTNERNVNIVCICSASKVYQNIDNCNLTKDTDDENEVNLNLTAFAGKG